MNNVRRKPTILLPFSFTVTRRGEGRQGHEERMEENAGCLNSPSANGYTKEKTMRTRETEKDKDEAKVYHVVTNIMKNHEGKGKE